MKIWLASYPRSGNTFARSVLDQVYGIQSAAFALEHNHHRFRDYDKADVVKTHESFEHIKDHERDYPKVYIVRDGRDCVVSMAHQARSLHGKKRSLNYYMLIATLALRGSHFNGWSKNAKSWINRADVVIRFEDLIREPIKEIEKLSPYLDLSNPNYDKLLSFDELKAGKSKFAKRKNDPNYAQKFFRRGKVGGWRDEMPKFIQLLFWQLHGKMLKQLNYPKH